MAETKRQSVAGKVAIPRTGAASPAQATSPAQEIIDNLSKAVGARIKLSTNAPYSRIYEGELFAVCDVSRLAAIATCAPPSSSSILQDYHIVPLARLQSFETISSTTAVTPTHVLPVDQNRLKSRLEDRIRKLKEEERNRGKGVTFEGQAIFDSFRRINTPIRWHNQEMIVHDAVIISPPYTVDDCRGAKDKQEVLNRVKKVLEGERRKLKEKQERERKTNTPASLLRKGG